jgi:hypothetical protein
LNWTSWSTNPKKAFVVCLVPLRAVEQFRLQADGCVRHAAADHARIEAQPRVVVVHFGGVQVADVQTGFHAEVWSLCDSALLPVINRRPIHEHRTYRMVFDFSAYHA